MSFDEAREYEAKYSASNFIQECRDLVIYLDTMELHTKLRVQAQLYIERDTKLFDKNARELRSSITKFQIYPTKIATLCRAVCIHWSDLK